MEGERKDRGEKERWRHGERDRGVRENGKKRKSSYSGNSSRCGASKFFFYMRPQKHKQN